jgi:hypothetical protein
VGVCDLWKHLHFYKKKLLHECKFVYNRIMKGVEIFVLKGFGVVHIKFMIGEWYSIVLIHRQYKDEKIFMQSKT